MTFLGLTEPEEDFATDYGRLMSWTENLATTIFVLAASDYNYEEVLAKDS